MHFDYELKTLNIFKQNQAWFLFEVGSFEVGSFEVGSFEVGSFKVESFEIGSFEVGSFEVQSFEVQSVNRFQSFIKLRIGCFS